MIQTFDFTGAGRQVDATGQFFRYENGGATDGNAAIMVRADGQDLGLYLPGDGLEMPAPAKVWEIRPRSPQAFGTVRVGQSRLKTSRVNGSMDVVTQGIARTIRNRAFTASYFVTSASSQIPEAQLWNPPNSGQAAIFTAFTLRTDVATAHILQTSAVALTNVAISGVPTSLLNGAPASSVGAPFELRLPSPPRSFINVWAPGIVHFGAAALFGGDFTPPDPIIILPGMGLNWMLETFGSSGLNGGVQFWFRSCPVSEMHL